MSKLASLISLQKHNLPVVPFEVLDETALHQQIADFVSKYSLETFMIRTDGKGNFSPSIINAVLTPELLEQTKALFNEGYKVFIGGDRGGIFKNFWSLNIQKIDDKIILEIVGPGFIATDLNRHGFLHESFELSFPDLEKLSTGAFLIKPENYEKERAQKREESMKKENFPQDAYINVYKQYPPLDEAGLEYVKKVIPNLIDVAKDLSEGKLTDFVASLSFLGDEKTPIFWDVYTIGKV